MHCDKQNVPLSQVIINPYVEEEYENVQASLEGFRQHAIYHDDILIEHAKEALKAAYIAEASTKFVIMAGLSFNAVVQNSLLKLLEEPPRNIRFIIIVPSKAILLPTVLSRLPFLRRKREREMTTPISFSFKNFDLAMLNTFIKEHDRIGRKDAKELLEVLCEHAVRDLGTLSLDQMQAFEEGFKLLELNGKVQVIFTSILLNFLPEHLS